ncbi:PRC-barrel domain containing protein [Streptomyces sp. NP160]|uniref:PRC-barrel domain-containing protein n=1 Tax=Streptomyces sp. NP160 TaxID=2586637 RepID=UPI00111B3E7D|nr:PRC-barrel domain-containing protein [Streptomyces sp. NP160]TNM67643.1 PRC-barrel domain containing protein [Streptomyces sp. NP160]
MPVRVGNIREWSGEDVVDEAGDKIGKLESIYVDTASDEPAFATVTVGVMSKKLVFVPIDDAVVGPGYVKVAYPKNRVKDAPSIETDGELRAEQEGDVFAHYGLTYTAAPSERRLGRR